MRERQTEVFAVIPAKGLDKAKSRLSPFLPIAERKELCLKMLEDVINAVKSVRNISQTVIVSNDLNVLHTTEKFGAEYLEELRGGLNQAVSQAIDWCCKRGASSVLVLPIDIPLVTPKDLEGMLALKDKASMVISPSRRGKGTNALLLTPPDVIPTLYGSQSFQRHLEEASDRGISFSCYRSKRIALDIDTVEDLIDFILTRAKETNAYKLLDKIEIPSKLIPTKTPQKEVSGNRLSSY